MSNTGRTDGDGRTALIHACIQGRTDCLDHLITPKIIEHGDGDGVTALMHACHQNYEGCVRYLLNAKADPTSNPSDSALIIATMQDNRINMQEPLDKGMQEC